MEVLRQKCSSSYGREELYTAVLILSMASDGSCGEPELSSPPWGCFVGQSGARRSGARIKIFACPLIGHNFRLVDQGAVPTGYANGTATSPAPWNLCISLSGPQIILGEVIGKVWDGWVLTWSIGF
jgi:hypothetical protein